jgi:Glutamyl-tRNAGlu reductase, dimerisation domain
MKPGYDSVERIRRHEISRALKKVNLSPEEEEVVDLFSRSLVGRLLHGPISEVMERAEAELSFRDRPGTEAPRDLEWHRGADKTPRGESEYQMCENGKPYVEREFELGSDQESSEPA